MKKLTLLVGIGIGYVLGSRAGRERFEQIRSGTRKVASSAPVQAATEKAQEAVKEGATAAAHVVAEKVHRGADASATIASNGQTVP